MGGVYHVLASGLINIAVRVVPPSTDDEEHEPGSALVELEYGKRHEEKSGDENCSLARY